MFEGKSFLDILQLGGFTMYVLLLCSIVTVTVIVERLLYFKKRSRKRCGDFMGPLAEALSRSDFAGALVLCEKEDSPFAAVAGSGLNAAGKSRDKIANAMDRQISAEVMELERSLSVLGTIGSTVVYVGLFGTVLGIIRSFQQIAESAGGGGGMDTVITGIAEALICTAAGILVAVPSVIAYNLFTKRVENFTTDMELVASETGDLLARD